MKIVFSYKIFLIFVFFLTTFVGRSQEDFKLVKIDNSSFPNIELYIRFTKQFDANAFSIYENNKKVNFVSDTILLKEYKKERSILLICDENPKEAFRNALIKVIRTFSKEDKMNLAFVLNEDTSNNIIHFLSPDFSDNHSFFIHALEQKTGRDIHYDVNRKSKKTGEKIQQQMFSKLDPFSNTGLIFLMDDLSLKPEPFSDILEGVSLPTYVLLINEPHESAQRELIEICTKTGGIYTIAGYNEIEKYLNLYLEDIALDVSKTKSDFYRIIFESKQNKEKNFFVIKYNDRLRHFVYTKPQKYLFSVIEKVLIILSGVLIILLILLLTGMKRRKLRRSSSFIDLKEKAMVKIKPVNPIEINIKTEGFNKTYFFEKHIIRIGRSSDNDIIIPDRTVSGSHAVINKEGDNYMVQDIGSTNGVILNQKKVKKNKLVSNDKIKLGSAILIVRIP